MGPEIKTEVPQEGRSPDAPHGLDPELQQAQRAARGLFHCVARPESLAEEFEEMDAPFDVDHGNGD